MTAKYTITIRNRRGIPRSEILDFQTLRINDSVNSVGSWNLTSTTRGKDPHPFIAGDGIIVKRDGVIIYSGVMTKVEAAYNPTMKAWTWTATGINDLAFCKWHNVRPSGYADHIEQGFWDNPQTIYWVPWYWTPTATDAQDRYHYIMTAWELITMQLPLTINDIANLHNIRGYEIVGQPELRYASPPKDIVQNMDVVLRYDNLLNTLLVLAEKGEFYITYKWDETNNKVRYVLTEGADMTDNIIFSFDNGTLQSLKYSMQAPDVTEVAASFNSLLAPNDTSGVHTPTADDYPSLYHYESRMQMIPSQELLTDTGWHKREQIIYPGKDFFAVSGTETYSFTWQNLQDYALKEGLKYVIGPDHGYEAGLNFAGTAPLYGRDFVLGDLVTVKLPDGTQQEERIVGMNYDVSYGKETITAVMGSLTGTFNAIYKDIESINKTLRRAEEGEIK